jgi:hypothetical protein
MYSYTAYNLCIHSEICLPELTVCEGSPDVIVRLGNLDNIGKETLDYGRQVLGELPGVGRLFIEDGRQITAELAPGVDESVLPANILGSGMSVLLGQRGLLVLHASSVAINGKAVAFMGSSGWGKSTLAAAFHAQGYPVLSDDVLPIQTDGEQPLVLPAFPQFKLAPEAAMSLGHDPASLSALFPNAAKLSYKFTHGFHQTPLPLQRIYVLGMGTHHKITRLHPQEIFPELVCHSRSRSALISPEFVAAHLRQCTKVIQKVSFCRFIRQPSLADLPYLVKLVENDLAQFSDCSEIESSDNVPVSS